jgi:acyl-CoA dehydrogenase family protein 9
VLGPEGKGFKVAMSILNSGRTGLGGGAVGGMKTLIRSPRAQAKDRKQFGKPIAEFGLVREKIAQMTIDCFAAESAVWMVAHLIDSGCATIRWKRRSARCSPATRSSAARYEALQIAAGNGFMKEFPYEQITRDARILSIFEGTNEILRLYIALSGLKDVGASLGELKSAVGDIFNNPIKGFGVLGGYASRRMREATGFGTDKIACRARTAPLRKLAALIYEKYVVELSQGRRRCCCAARQGHRRRAVPQKRMADLPSTCSSACAIADVCAGARPGRGGAACTWRTGRQAERGAGGLSALDDAGLARHGFGAARHDPRFRWLPA